IYERIVAQGKSKKLALIAVVNKLIKQAFAIAKSGLPYHENYVSKLS
ncbi:IS110 family transposase, partial [Mangrovimonas sp. AS39]|nr:IS110 family transposase [Mangrovimonas futianensis]MCF1196826.1 IS110 family transposase [Mangrovimonas futianensis]